MIAFATVLSMLKLLEMPYSGSVTVASMLPILIISYRHGIGMGLGSGLVYAVIQQLLGLNSLSYVTGWQSILAVILLDYIIAFTLVGLGGIFRGKIAKNTENAEKRQSTEFAMGMLFVCVLRYLCHTVSGATVWAGISIPTKAALIYSIGYNATYMIPETIVNITVAVFIGSAIDFSRDIPMPMKKLSANEKKYITSSAVLSLISKLLFIVTVIADTLLVFAHMQDPNDGKFTFEYIKEANIAAILTVSGIGVVLSAALYVLSRCFAKKARNI